MKKEQNRPVYLIHPDAITLGENRRKNDTREKGPNKRVTRPAVLIKREGTNFGLRCREVKTGTAELVHRPWDPVPGAVRAVLYLRTDSTLYCRFDGEEGLVELTEEVWDERKADVHDLHDSPTGC